MTDILDDVRDLKRLAATEHNHHYVAGCVERVIGEICRLRFQVDAVTRAAIQIKIANDIAVKDAVNVNSEYLDSMTADELKEELRYALKVKYSILNAIRDNPEMPPPLVLKHLGAASNENDRKKGKELQAELGRDAIPPKAECEWGAGVWFRIRRGLSGKLALTSQE